MDREAWRAAVHVIPKSQTRLSPWLTLCSRRGRLCTLTPPASIVTACSVWLVDAKLGGTERGLFHHHRSSCWMAQRAEGLLFLHGLESNPGSSLQTEEEAGLP